MKPRTAVLQGGRDVEGSVASKRAATDRSDNDRNSVYNGIGVDGTWKHQ